MYASCQIHGLKALIKAYERFDEVQEDRGSREREREEEKES